MTQIGRQTSESLSVRLVHAFRIFLEDAPLNAYSQVKAQVKALVLSNGVSLMLLVKDINRQVLFLKLFYPKQQCLLDFFAGVSSVSLLAAHWLELSNLMALFPYFFEQAF